MNRRYFNIIDSLKTNPAFYIRMALKPTKRFYLPMALLMQFWTLEKINIKYLRRTSWQSNKTDLINKSRTNDPGKDSIFMIIQKSATPEEDGFNEYPYYIPGIQGKLVSPESNGSTRVFTS